MRRADVLDNATCPRYVQDRLVNADQEKIKSACTCVWLAHCIILHSQSFFQSLAMSHCPVWPPMTVECNEKNAYHRVRFWKLYLSVYDRLVMDDPRRNLVRCLSALLSSVFATRLAKVFFGSLLM